MIHARHGPVLLGLMVVGLAAGCASSPDASPEAETALSCEDLSVAVPDVERLDPVYPEDISNWRQVEQRIQSGRSRTARWSTSPDLAVEVRPDGSVARACVANPSDLVSLDRTVLDALEIARFRQETTRASNRWVRF